LGIYNLIRKRLATQGMALLECMIAISLALIIISVVFNVYIGVQKNFTIQTSLNKIQFTARQVNDILVKEIHQAGYIGCAHFSANFPLVSYQNHDLTEVNKLVITGHAFMVRHASVENSELIADMRDFSTFIVDTHVPYRAGDVLMVSDCRHAEIIKVNRIHYRGGDEWIETERPLTQLFIKHAEVSRFEENYFFVQGSGLYKQTRQGQRIKLVDGVKSMRIDQLSAAKVLLFSLELAHEQLTKKWYIYVKV